MAIDGQQDISLLDSAALLSRLTREKLLYPDEAPKISGGRVQLTHQEAEAQPTLILDQSHFLGVVFEVEDRAGNGVMIR